MRYALLVYSDQSTWDGLSEADAAALRDEAMPRWIELFEAMGAADPSVEGRELEPAAGARVVRVRDGERIVTDGPFAEAKEHLGGLFVTDLPHLDEAIRIAGLVPTAAHGSIEIRPLAQ
jgi:hypothetical protein